MTLEEKLIGNEDAAQFIIVDQNYEVTTDPSLKLSEDSGEVSDYWRMERFRKYTFTVCLLDRHEGRVLRDQKFSVNSYRGEMVAQTGQDGCFRWEETIEYNYFADAKYVLLERTLRGRQAYRGSFTLEIAVNPWSSRDKTGGEVVFLKPKRGVVSEDVLVRGQSEIQKALFGEGQNKPFFLDRIHVELAKDASVREINKFLLLLSRGVLEVRASNIEGKEQPIHIKDGGHFRVFSRLLQHHEVDGSFDSLDEGPRIQGHRVVLMSKGLISFSLERQTTDEYLRIQLKKTMGRNWYETTRGYLALRLQPLNFPFENFFETFDGLYDLEYLDNLHTGVDADIRDDYSLLRDKDMVFDRETFDRIFAYEKIERSEFIKEEILASPTRQSTSGATLSSMGKKGLQLLETSSSSQSSARERMIKNPGQGIYIKYDFTDMRPHFEEVLRGETATTRGVSFRVKTCLKEKLNGRRPGLGEPFEVTIIDDTKKRTVKDLKIKGSERCLNFVHKFWYKHFKPERQFIFEMEVREARSGTIVGIISFGINPWDWGWTFGRDRIELSDEYIQEVEEQEKIPSRFLLPFFYYDTIRFRYEVDKFFNLKVKKAVNLHLQPKMLRYNSRVGGRTGIFGLRDGIYLMKASLEKQYLDPTTDGVVHWVDKQKGESNGVHRVTLNSGGLKKQHYISAVKMLVRVIDGRIITPVELGFRDPKIMRIRSQLMIQLEPIEEWRHYVVKLYNDFYERQIQEIPGTGVVLDRKSWENLREEKIRNIRQIIAKMSQNDRRVHELIDERYSIDRKSGKKYTIQGQTYSGCYGVPEITWEDIFTEFDLDHSELSTYFQESLSYRDRQLKDLSGLRRTQRGDDCYSPYNVVAPLILNDFMEVDLAPIVGLDLNEFVESPESSGLERETFFGPITFLINGNGSSMRPTRNVSEYMCPDVDCDQLKAETKKEVEASFRAVIEIAQQEAKQEALQKGVRIDDFYDDSPYFNSTGYLNNIHVDDLIEEFKKQEARYNVMTEAQAQIYYYLRKYNFNFLSTKNEPLYRVNVSQCEDELSNTSSIEPCLREVDEYKWRLEDFSDRPREEVESDLADFVSFFEVSEDLAGEICGHLAYQVARVYEKSGYVAVAEGKSRRWTNRCMRQFQVINKKLDQCREEYEEGTRQRKRCESDVRVHYREDRLNIERKIRIKETGRYFHKGGKTQNVNVGSSFSLSYGEEFSHSFYVSFHITDVVKMLASLSQTVSAVLSPVLNIFSIDYRVSQSKSNSRSSGTTISERTFLLMEEAAMDVEITDYIKCASVAITPEFFGKRELNRHIDRLIRHDLDNGLITEDAQEDTRYKYFLEFTRGLFICADYQESPLPLGVRESFYYFIQHFTDGYMLDPGDLSNLPWLLQMRGKTDLWRFLDRIKAQRVQLSENKFPIGPVTEEDRWPIEKLISAYSGVIPTFPGIYTLLHNEYEYASDYPWSDQPEDSFDPDFLDSLVGTDLGTVKDPQTPLRDALMELDGVVSDDSDQ